MAVSLKYGVICSHTAFVAISEKEVPGQKPVRVEIPVNLPHGWDYDKIFGKDQQHIMMHLMSKGAGPSRLGAVGAASLMFDDTEAELLEEVNVYEEVELEATSADDDDESSSLALEVGGVDMTPKDTDIDIRRKPEAKPIELLIEILIEAVRGVREVAEGFVEDINWTVSEIRSWDEETRAKVFYFAVALLAYSLGLNKEIYDALNVEPKQSEIAKLWYNLAKKELGAEYQKPTLLPSLPDGSDEYLAWKFGLAEKPTGHWKNIP